MLRSGSCYCSLIQPALAIDVPPAPVGFTWQEVPELKAAFLKPNGWFYRKEEQQGTFAIFITKEDISKGGEFQTGLTLNVFHLKKDPATEHGKSMIENIARSKHGEMWTQKLGPFIEFGCQVKDTDATGTTVTHARPSRIQKRIRFTSSSLRVLNRTGTMLGRPASR
jgi:hypothetical protein